MFVDAHTCDVQNTEQSYWYHSSFLGKGFYHQNKQIKTQSFYVSSKGPFLDYNLPLKQGRSQP